MKEYLKRFALIVALMAGMIAILSLYVWCITVAFSAFGFLGGMGAILLTSCALAALMPDGGTGPR